MPIAGYTRSILLIVLATSTIAMANCTDVECGVGTLEQDGECVRGEGGPSAAECCAESTHFDPVLLTCLPDWPPTICDPESTLALVGEDGVIVCLGIGSADQCQVPCPIPHSNHNTICGRLVDLETGTPIEVDGGGIGRRCGNIAVEERTGPCLLEIKFFDFQELANNPTAAQPLSVETLEVSDCGYFAAWNIPTPALGFLAVVVSAVDGMDNRASTLKPFAIAPGDRRYGESILVLRRSTDESWTNDAQDPFAGPTFSEHGALLVTFLRGSTPVEGVMVVGADSGTYYFSDLVAIEHSTIDVAKESTGPNGSALLTADGLVAVGGSGGLPAECTWSPSDLLRSIPGFLFVLERYAENASTGEPCE